MQDWNNSKLGFIEFMQSQARPLEVKPQEVDEEIFYYFLEILPPQEDGKTRHDFISLPIPVQYYFLVGEPYSHQNGQPVYTAFARAYDDKYFYLGTLPSLIEEQATI